MKPRTRTIFQVKSPQSWLFPLIQFFQSLFASFECQDQKTFSAETLHFSIIDGNHLECILTRLLCKTSIHLRFCWILTDLVRQAAGISQQRPDIGILVWRILDNIFKKPRHFWLRERIWPMYRYLANLLLEISNNSIEIEWIRV